jgi:D-threo-aldose 1-dehydrogenase
MNESTATLMPTRHVGRTGLHISEIGVGTGVLGNLYHEVSDEQATAVIDTAWESGQRYFDTAPFYGLGLSERRVGAALRQYERDDYILSTKVGKLLHPAEPASERYGFVNALPNDIEYDYSYDGIMRSVESSLERLGVGRLDILYMHDIGRFTHGDANDHHFPIAMESGYRALDELRSNGTISAFGLGVNEIEVCAAAMQHGYWDCFMFPAGVRRCGDVDRPGCAIQFGHPGDRYTPRRDRILRLRRGTTARHRPGQRNRGRV